MNKNQLKAVHQRDLKKLLTSLGVYQSLCSQREACFFCRDAVDADSLAAVFPYNGAVRFCCGKPACGRALLDLESDGTADG